MEPERDPADLLALTQLCAAANRPESLIASSLPVIRTVADAAAALVAAHSADRPVLRAVDGQSLPVDEVALPDAREGLVLVDVPATWAAAGIGTTLGQLLPGHSGALLIAWTGEPAANRAVVDAAVSVLDVALARLDAEERLTDLVQRVDNAQHLAGMGDYDWHIPTDTNRWSDQLFRRS
jgi:hypothetical protein